MVSRLPLALALADQALITFQQSGPMWRTQAENVQRWQQARRAAGKDTATPNLVMSSAVQVCWEKFCNYFEVEPKWVPISPDHLVLDGHELEKYVDENTIGVVAIMGQTYTGMYEPVTAIAAKLDEIQAEGLVERRPDPADRRARRVELTEADQVERQRRRARIEMDRARAAALKAAADSDIAHR
mgnify:CR=1 FL=1